MKHQKLAAPILSAILLTGSVAFAQAGPGGPPPAAEPADIAKDPVLIALKDALAPNARQLESLEERVAKWRAEQRKALDEFRRELRGGAGGPAGPGGPGGPGGRGGPGAERPSPELRAANEKKLASKIDPLNAAFMKDLRASLADDAQRTKLDEAAKTLDLAPPRMFSGGRAQAPAAPLPPHMVRIEVKDGVRTITSNGIPDHKPGQFPGRGNPNAISAQSYTFRMPEQPKVNAEPTPHRGLLAGVALNGIVLDPGTAEAWRNDPRTGWRQEAISPMTIAGAKMGLDTSNAHVQPNGAYHYHAAPEGLIELLCKAKGVKDGEAMLLIGWSADGFPIYDHHGYSRADDAKSPLKELHSSWRLKKGERPGGDAGPGGAYDGTYTQDFEFVAGSGDLDECNGRVGVTPEFPQGTYYYVITGEFPFISRSFRGTPDRSFAKNDHPNPGGGAGAGGRGARGRGAGAEQRPEQRPGQRPGPGGPPPQ